MSGHTVSNRYYSQLGIKTLSKFMNQKSVRDCVARIIITFYIMLSASISTMCQKINIFVRHQECLLKKCKTY